MVSFAVQSIKVRLGPICLLLLLSLLPWETELGKHLFCCCSVLCLTLCDPTDCACQPSLSFTISRSLLKFMFIELVMLSNYLTLCFPLLLLPSVFSSITVFSLMKSVLHIRWPKYWSFSFSISPCNEYSGLISFRMDWLDLLAVQGTLKSLLQHHSSKASILWRSAFFIVSRSHPYMTTGKTIAGEGNDKPLQYSCLENPMNSMKRQINKC